MSGFIGKKKNYLGILFHQTQQNNTQKFHFHINIKSPYMLTIKQKQKQKQKRDTNVRFLVPIQRFALAVTVS